MDTGGLAQMTYGNFASNMNGGLGVPGAGYASRGKASGLKRLSVAPSVASIAENQVDAAVPTPPRTSRSHLLAGLRTAPKTPSGLPASAPYNQTQHPLGHKYGVPHTATGSSFTAQQLAMNPGSQFYALPEQVLAPPPLEFDDEQVDPVYLAELAAAEQSLNQRAQLLQQQLANLQLANRQLQASYPRTPLTPQLSLYQQQLLNNTAPQVQEVPGQPGVYIVYNPLTGQSNYFVDPSAQSALQLANSPPPPTPSATATGFNVDASAFRAEVSPPVESASMESPFSRTMSPPKKTPSPPQDVEPLPPPSANAFRRGSKKLSPLTLTNLGFDSGPKSATGRSFGLPATPSTGTFGPGQGRAGEHPIRQPRGPPSIEELKAKPTQKDEGSKNFLTRTRRKAVHNLVQASLGRRVRPGSGSAGSMTPVSETELTFSIPSDNDSDSGRSGSLSGKPSIGSLRAAASGAIGSERKRSHDRLPSPPASNNVDVVEPNQPQRRQRTPLLMLANAAEKRKSGFY